MVVGSLKKKIAGIENEGATVVASHPGELMDAPIFDPDFEVDGKTMRREPAALGRFLGAIIHGFAKTRLRR